MTQLLTPDNWTAPADVLALPAANDCRGTSP